MKQGNQKKGNQWKPFLKFYTRFPIPWGLYIISMALGLIYAELSLKVAGFLVQVNQGQLYNGVILGYVLLTLLNALLVAFQNISGGYANERITLRSRRVVWKKILCLPLSQVERQQPSNLISCITNDVTQASQSMTQLFLTVASCYGFVRTMLLLLQYNAQLATWLIFAVPLVVAVFFLVGRMQYSMLRKQYGALNVMTGHFSQHLSGMKHVKTQNIEEKELQAGYEAIEARYRADVYYAFMGTLQVMMNTVYTRITTVIIAVGGAGYIRQGVMESAGINKFSTYMNNVNQYLAELLTHYQTIKGAQGCLTHVNEVLELPEESISEPEGEDWRKEGILPGERDIVFEDVRFSFDGEQEILRGASFRIPHGKRTAIIGDNGCGKSTALKLLQGLYPISSGHIRIGDVDISELPLQQLRAHFGYVLQSAPLFSGTVYDNIVYGMEAQFTREQVEQAARMADAHDFIMELPEGYETQVGENGCHLSGGQRQRVSIARAFIRHTSFLLMDEAASSLDYQSAARVMGARLSGAEDDAVVYNADTVVYISHNLKEIQAADHVVVLSRGLVEAEGAPGTLWDRSETYRVYAASQMRREA